jgi:hypothetical protein
VDQSRSTTPIEITRWSVEGAWPGVRCDCAEARGAGLGTSGLAGIEVTPGPVASGAISQQPAGVTHSQAAAPSSQPSGQQQGGPDALEGIASRTPIAISRAPRIDRITRSEARDAIR